MHERPAPPERAHDPVEAGSEPPPRREPSHESRRDGGGEPRRDEPRRDEPRRRDRFQQPHEQPEFLRRPVRRARSDSEPAPPARPRPRKTPRATDAPPIFFPRPYPSSRNSRQRTSGTNVMPV